MLSWIRGGRSTSVSMAATALAELDALTSPGKRIAMEELQAQQERPDAVGDAAPPGIDLDAGTATITIPAS